MTPADVERHARTLWARTRGQAWEPPDPRHPLIAALVEGGFLRRTDGVCGFERFKDSMVAWTQAGRLALTQPETTHADS